LLDERVRTRRTWSLRLPLDRFAGRSRGFETFVTISVVSMLTAGKLNHEQTKKGGSQCRPARNARRKSSTSRPKRLNIKGRSKMNKGALKAALARRGH
jgi:hypothetical protein